MQFKEGASVYSADDEKVGSIDRIVLNPHTKEITHVVVQKGFIFKDDKVVPIDAFKTVTSEKATLCENKADLKEYPDFEDSNYVIAEDTVPPAVGSTNPIYPLFYYPPVRAGWVGAPGPYAGPLYVKTTRRNIPENSVAIDEGTNVVSSDGEDIGEVARVYADDQERATHLLVSEGVFLKEKKLIPTIWITGMKDDKIQLSVDAKFLERLPDYPV